MTTAEILGIVGSALGGGTLGAVATAWAARGKAREASATAVVKPLIKRIETLETREGEVQAAREQDRSDYTTALDTLQAGIAAQLAESDERCREQLRESEERCERRSREEREEHRRETQEAVEAATAPLRDQLARAVELAAEARRQTGDITGAHRVLTLAHEVRRTPTPPDMPVHPAEDKED